MEKRVGKSTNNGDGKMISQATNGTNNRDGFILSINILWNFQHNFGVQVYQSNDDFAKI